MLLFCCGIAQHLGLQSSRLEALEGLGSDWWVEQKCGNVQSQSDSWMRLIRDAGFCKRHVYIFRVLNLNLNPKKYRLALLGTDISKLERFVSWEGTAFKPL